MTIHLLLKIEAPDVALHAPDVHTDLRQLVVDSLEIGLHYNPNFQIQSDLKPDLSQSVLLTKADLARHFQISFRTVERWAKQNKLPAPIRVSSAHCVNGAPRWLPEDIATFEVPATPS